MKSRLTSKIIGGGLLLFTIACSPLPKFDNQDLHFNGGLGNEFVKFYEVNDTTNALSIENSNNVWTKYLDYNNDLIPDRLIRGSGGRHYEDVQIHPSKLYPNSFGNKHIKKFNKYINRIREINSQQ